MSELHVFGRYSSLADSDHGVLIFSFSYMCRTRSPCIYMFNVILKDKNANHIDAIDIIDIILIFVSEN
jgi:hypothetical protein